MRQMIRVHGELGGKLGTSVWYLATNTYVVKFYMFKAPENSSEPIEGYTLIDTFDRAKLPAAGDKKTAASWAKRLGLGSWAYVRI